MFGYLFVNVGFSGVEYETGDLIEDIAVETCFPENNAEWSFYEHFGDVNGGTYKVVWIILFNSSSHISQIEAELTENVFNYYRDNGLAVIAAGSNWEGDYSCDEWGTEFSLSYPIVDDSNMNFRSLFTDGSVPHHILLDHQMRVIYSAQGTIIPPTGDEFINVLDDAMEDLESLLVVPHLKDWNMVGLPVNVSDASPSNVFPGFMEGTLFSFEDTYVNSDELIPGEGYWINFPYAGHAAFNGNNLPSLTITLSEGWNLISGISVEIDFADIFDPGQIIVPGSLYEFGGTYVNALSIQSGKGYWINAFSDGNITLSSGSSSEKTKSSFHDYSEDANKLYINTKPLYFGVSVPETELIFYQLPPKPPLGAFDIRFDTGNKITGNSSNVKIQNDEEILTISAEINIPIESQNIWILEVPDGRKFNLSEGNTIFLDGDISSLSLRKTKMTPEHFSLHQNYPNPFNPLTTLNFEMPEQGNVTLLVYDLLGNEIRNLIKDNFASGFHSVQWNGTDDMGNPVSSGCYFIQLKITSINQGSNSIDQFVQTRKLVLLK